MPQTVGNVGHLIKVSVGIVRYAAPQLYLIGLPNCEVIGQYPCPRRESGGITKHRLQVVRKRVKRATTGVATLSVSEAGSAILEIQTVGVHLSRY